MGLPGLAPNADRAPPIAFAPDLIGRYVNR